MIISNRVFLNKLFVFVSIILFLRSEFFSEIYIDNLRLKNHIIISLTTTKEKIESLLIDRLIKSLLEQTIVPYKILISVNKADIAYLSDFLKSLVNNIIELIFINDDFDNFNRYYYIPDEYKKYIVVIVDDDISLEKNAIEKLFESYILYPNAVSARRIYKMNFNEQFDLKPFNYWEQDYIRTIKPKFFFFAIHGEGTLFPPNVLNFNEDFIFYFRRVIKADDFIMKYFELDKNLKTIYVNNTSKYRPLNTTFYEKYDRIFSICPNELQLAEDFKKVYNLSIHNNILKDKAVISNKTKDYFLHSINHNKITDDTLLVSMTTYPPRLAGITEVLLSLLYQSADITLYQCFLTLAKEEFINGERDLPLDVQKLIKNGWIKIIWHHNIYSHKKLMPIIQLYPENDILIVDDDVIRTKNFIEIFQRDHSKYPNDVICGQFNYFYNNKIEIQRMKGYKGKNCGEFNAIPDIIFQTGRSANGGGGVLYPKHTFYDKRFFNESLYMNLSPTSDESWQYTFLIIENKIVRQTSIIIDSSVNFVNNSQKISTSLHKVNKDKYSLINENLMKKFPEYIINSLERQKKIIVSLTSNKKNFQKLNLVLESILNNTMKPSKIILTLYKDDIVFLTSNLKSLISNNIIELIISDFKLKSHLKYFEVMKKYRDYAIIIIKDDIIYTNDLIESLFNSYTSYPFCIHARNVHKIMIKNDKVTPHKTWLKHYTFELNPSFYLLASSDGGTLFPPNILNISNENINEIYKFLRHCDIYLKFLSLERNIKIKWVPNKFPIGLKQIKNNKNYQT